MPAISAATVLGGQARFQFFDSFQNGVTIFGGSYPLG
ncbi:MAG: hypothetical protein ALAOOOJD_02630 [bacterium]|nr:hypothetical protein [bacterium]